MEVTELYYPQIAVRAGPYCFNQGIEIEIHSAKSSYFSWAKIRFTENYHPKLILNRDTPATIQLGYHGILEDVFTGYIAAPYNQGSSINEIMMKDEMMKLENTMINDTFLDTTPQEMLAFILAKAGFTQMKLSTKVYPIRRMLPIKQQNAVQAIHTIHAAWGIRVPFFFSGGIFYWDEKPEQKKIYTFTYGVNILSLNRTGGIWKLETVSMPFIKHSHKIHLIHPQITGEVKVLKVELTTNDSGFIRTYIYF